MCLRLELIHPSWRGQAGCTPWGPRNGESPQLPRQGILGRWAGERPGPKPGAPGSKPTSATDHLHKLPAGGTQLGSSSDPQCPPRVHGCLRSLGQKEDKVRARRAAGSPRGCLSYRVTSVQATFSEAPALGVLRKRGGGELRRKGFDAKALC